MREPKMSDLKMDRKGTKRMRSRMLKKKVKITINLDSDLISRVRKTATETGSPYQTYINYILREALSTKENQKKRLDRLEKELAQIKKRLAA